MFFAMVYGPLVISLLLAGLAAGATWRAALSVPISVRIITGAAMVLALGTVIARWIWSFSPFWIPDFSGPDADLLLTLTSLLLPLMVGTIAVILQMLPPPQSGPRGTAALTPRNLLTYAPRGWLWILGSLLALVMLVSVLAGLLSTTDDWGRHVMYEVLASNTTSAGTRIYGWWFSMRCLVALAALVATLLAGLAVLARPAVGIDAEADARARRARSRSLIVTATGAVLLHFHAVLGSLAGTSSLTLGFDSGATGWVSLGSSFAALGPVLQVASWIALTAGLTTWWYVLFSIAPVRSRRRAESTAS
jgi:hypothetical protein